MANSKTANTQQLAFLPSETVAKWLDGLAQTKTLVAPQDVAGVLLYMPVKSSREIAWGFSRPVMSIKEIFFPPTERLLSIQKSGGQVTVNETLPEGETVIFGARPCDARGVKVLDALFLDTGAVDPYYARHRQNTSLIGLACKEMGPTCFCTTLDGAPDDNRDMDVMLYEVDGGYAVEAVTEKGKALLQTIDMGQRTANKPASIVHQPFDIPHPNSISWPGHFSDEYWTRMSERCLSCRACAYVCPTCRCFAIRDEALTSPGQYERIRCWDSCEGENYRRIAGGHRQRAEKSERVRNRFFCKFHYYPAQYGLGEMPACTGCGRCIDVCPVNVDITEVLMDLGRSR